jgi:sorbose reductase
MGDNSQPAAPIDERASLTSRVIPQMTLSTATNPLTRPLPRISAVTPADRALARFAITGACILTGGAGTLALASARALLEHGASGIALFDLPGTLASSSTAIQQLQTDFPSRSISTHNCNVTDPASIAAAFASATATHPDVSTVCCFAGIVGCVPSVSAPASQFRNVVDVNLTGSFLCAQAAAEHFIKQGRGGSVLFTASISAHTTNFPQPQVAYNVSKAGVAHMARNLGAEWAVHGIRVNVVSPGYLDTVLNAGESLEGVREVWAGRCPMGRMGDVEEVVGVVVMLSSQRAGRYMTGTEVVVDGGALCF